jgi:hypothetical protein
MRHVVEKLRKSAQEKNLTSCEGEIFSLLQITACFQCCSNGSHGGNKSCADERVDAP